MGLSGRLRARRAWQGKSSARLVLVALVGTVLGFTVGRLSTDLDALTLLTGALVLVTIYYAWQTREMVMAMREQLNASTALADRLRAQPAIEEWLQRCDDFTRNSTQVNALTFERSLRERLPLVADVELVERTEVVRLAMFTYANDNTLRDEGSSAMVVRVLVVGFREALTAGLRGLDLPSIPDRWLERPYVQAAVIDAPQTLQKWR